MSQYTSPSTSREFIDRTKKIISQYKERESYLGNEYYDVTLLLNCLLGLVVIPREKSIDSLQDIDIPECLKKTIHSSTDKDGQSINIQFKEYIVGLRNGIVHFSKDESLNFRNKDGKIDRVEINGSTKNYKHKIVYHFNLGNGNEIESAIEKILNYINVGT